MKKEKLTTTLLEDLEDIVGQLQMEKIDEKETIEVLSDIVANYINDLNSVFYKKK